MQCYKLKYFPRLTKLTTTILKGSKSTVLEKTPIEQLNFIVDQIDTTYNSKRIYAKYSNHHIELIVL